MPSSVGHMWLWRREFSISICDFYWKHKHLLPTWSLLKIEADLKKRSSPFLRLFVCSNVLFVGCFTKKNIYDKVLSDNCVLCKDTDVRSIIQGPQNTQIAKYIVGGTQKKTLLALLIPNIFLIFLWNYFSMHLKALLKPTKIWNLSKNAQIWAA